MKRALTIFLIPVFILTATVGVTSTSYSCKGMGGESMAKPCCKNTGNDGCCKKESVVLKIQDAFIKAVNNSTLSASLYFIREQNPEISFLPVLKNASYAKYQWDNAPPIPHVGFYILYGSLII
jgi:hypothetical protein